MNKFLHHEPLASGLFNRTHNSAGQFKAWDALLCNSEPLLELVCFRMESDFLAQNVKMRKPYGAKDIEA